MSSSVVAYGEAPPAHIGAGLEPERHIEPERDRGKDWPLAVVVFVPVLVAYGGTGYGAYAILSALL